MRAPFYPLVLALLCSCASHHASKSLDAPALQIGDCLLIQFTHRPDLEYRQTVKQDGSISLPLIGELVVANMTLRQVGKLIKARYIDFPPDADILVTLCPR